MFLHCHYWRKPAVCLSEKTRFNKDSTWTWQSAKTGIWTLHEATLAIYAG